MNTSWQKIEEFLTYPIIGKKGEDGFHLDTWMVIVAVIGIVITSIFLNFVKRFFTRKMDIADKRKFDSIFKFFH